MSVGLGSSHARTRTIEADAIVCRTLHVDVASTGAGVGGGGGGGAGSFTSLTVSGTTTLTGATAVAGALTLTNTLSSNSAITTTGAVTAQSVVLGTGGSPLTISAAGNAITNVSTINGAAYPPPVTGTGAFTTLTVSGASTLAAVNATNVSASGTLSVTGTSTLAAVNATNVSASGTLSVTGASTLAAVNATNVSASGTLGVTGASTLGAVDAGAVTATSLTAPTAALTAITGVSTINAAPYPLVRPGAAPIVMPAGSVFPTLTLPSNTTGKYFIVTPASFASQPSNGIDPANPRGGNPVSVAATITGFSNPQNLRDFWVYNASRYSFYLPLGSFGSTFTSKARDVWLPATWLHYSERTTGGAGNLELDPIAFSSQMVPVSAAAFSSSEATIGDAHMRYSLSGTPGPNSGMLLEGLVQVEFVLAAPADPVRIRVSLPVGPNASVMPPQMRIPTVNDFVADWVADPGFHPGNRPVLVGVGSMGASPTFVPDDATARVRMYVEVGAAGAGYATLVVAGFTGGAGTYWACCPFAIQLDNLLYRATYD